MDQENWWVVNSLRDWRERQMKTHRGLMARYSRLERMGHPVTRDQGKLIEISSKVIALLNDEIQAAYNAVLPPANVEIEREDWQPIETAPRAHMNCEMKGRYTDEGAPGLYAFRATHWRARSQKAQNP